MTLQTFFQRIITRNRSYFLLNPLLTIDVISTCVLFAFVRIPIYYLMCLIGSVSQDSIPKFWRRCSLDINCVPSSVRVRLIQINSIDWFTHAILTYLTQYFYFIYEIRHHRRVRIPTYTSSCVRTPLALQFIRSVM